ncbi:ABC transporter permease [Blautia pseudococcoides]|uniref:ABC transporter permease n=1 Tax=Blautia pseudococcoides TaxID=1796616 RepID=UPI00148AF49A|nr:ABC transporter permease [Blautia pseudococcoides]QJU15355.1 ABC transporter permease [Blautia pseudococcoides]
MFSNLILRNSRRNRKENGLFFGSLVISIVAFYIILSLSKQDVMIFLAKMESDAVNRLLLMIPVFYVMTLGILFFLSYFACKYQLERRRKEFGVYLMMGMRRSKLFIMLLAEDLLSSILALVIGIPVAVLLSELISLVTARLVGMGIIGHQFTFSLSAVCFTIAGFLAIKLAAFLILSGKISRQEIGTLLAHSSGNEKKQKPAFVYGICTVLGVIMLAAAYTMAIQGIAWSEADMMLLTMLLGLLGTILLFYGMRAIIALLVKAGKANRKLHVFSFRQIQENVIHQSTSMAISSLLILAALCCFGAGIGIASTSQQGGDHVLDYTFREYNTEDPQDALPHLQTVLKENNLESHFSRLFEMRIGYVQTTKNYDNVFQMDSVMESLRNLTQSEDRDVLLNNLSYASYPHLICLSDYNGLLKAAGKPALTLAENEAAVYQDTEFTNASRMAMFNKILSGHPEAMLEGNPVYLTGEIQSVDLVTDRSITLSFALILPDEQFLQYTNGDYEVYINGIMSQDATRAGSLMNAISDMNARLDGICLQDMGIEYESYLQNIGRQLFYMVAASYITIYLAIIFLVVANTIMGVQFLMDQQQTGRRYQTLVHLGATYKDICLSARKQISWFMGVPVFVAAISSIFGVKALFTGLLSSRLQGTQREMLVVSAAMIFLLCVVEYIYMTVIKRSSDRYLLTLMQPQREE